MVRIARAAAIGIIAYLSFRMFPYFPVSSGLCFAFLISLIAYKFVRIAIIMSMTVFTVVLSYHSAPLAILYMIAGLAFVFTTVWSSSFPDMFLMMAGAPVLAALSLSGFPIPLEFSAIYLVPILLKGRKVPVIAGIACLLCCIYGIVGRHEVIGHLVIGKPMYWFYYVSQRPRFFYDLSWFDTRFSSDTVTLGRLFGILKNMGMVFVARPVVLLQSAFWATVSYFIASFIRKKKWWSDLIGVMGGTALIILLQFVITALYQGKVKPDMLGFSISLTIMMMAVLGGLELKYLRARRKQISTVRPKKKKRVRLPKPLPRTRSQPIEDVATMKPENLSLKDWLRIQRVARDHIEEKFTQTVTAMDIDVAESTKLKHGEKDGDITLSFSQYWEFIDKAIEKNDGKLISRAGDGAMYVFKSADQALRASESIVQGLSRFNKTKNRLGLPFALRIGLNTGDIIRDEGEPSGEVFSRVLDIAGHLQKMANSGQILLSENTYKRLKNKSGFEKSDYLTRDDVEVYAFKQ
jgi:class 3 adenylate cyclase